MENSLYHKDQQSLTIIAKATNECNMGCLYCYALSKTKPIKMSLGIAENMLRKISKFNEPFHRTEIIWHGGEPLLLGIAFYNQIVNIQKQINLELNEKHEFINCVQTNGTLISSEMLDFFQENRFRLGSSLDGIKSTHDQNRPYKSGSSSFDDVFNFLLEAQKRGLKVGAVCVLNKITEPHLEEIYQFFKSNNLHLKVNPQFSAGRALINTGLELEPREFGKAMIKLFDIWFYDNTLPDIPVEPFPDIMTNIGLFRNKENQPVHFPFGCHFRNNCANTFICVDYLGRVFPCGRFEETDFQMGDINIDSMEAIISSPPHQLFIKRHEDGVKVCKKCGYRPICNSGCADTAYLMRGCILQKDGFCEGYKMLFQHIENAMKKELEVINE